MPHALPTRLRFGCCEPGSANLLAQSHPPGQIEKPVCSAMQSPDSWRSTPLGYRGEVKGLVDMKNQSNHLCVQAWPPWSNRVTCHESETCECWEKTQLLVHGCGTCSQSPSKWTGTCVPAQQKVLFAHNKTPATNEGGEKASQETLGTSKTATLEGKQLPQCCAGYKT